MTIDGDVNGDGKPDITLRDRQRPRGPGFTISSGGNTIRGLTLEGFFVAISSVLAGERGSVPTGRTFAGNTVSRLTIRGVGNGIYFGPNGAACDRGGACATQNVWRDLRIVGNTIDSRHGAIGVNLIASVGDRLEGLTISGNTIRVPPRDRCIDPSGQAIDVVAGASVNGDRQNRMSDVLISNNTISGGLMGGIRVTAGADGADANVVERVRIVGNRIRIDPARTHTCAAQLIILSTGDYALFQRGKYAEDNLLRDVEVSGNYLRGNESVWVFAGGAGAARNTIRDLRVERNRMDVIGPFSGVHLYGAQGGVDRPTRSGRIADVVVHANRIVITKASIDHVRPADGGISVIGGDSTGLPGGVRGSTVERVRITNNVIDTTLVGVSVVGGSAWAREGPAIGNVVRDVVIEGNRVLRAPKPNPSYEAGVREIRVAGGIGKARRNRVACVRIRGTPAMVVANARPEEAPGASGNSVSLAC